MGKARGGRILPVFNRRATQPMASAASEAGQEFPVCGTSLLPGAGPSDRKQGVTPEPEVPPPPDQPEQLLAWAHAYGVSARLDDVFIGSDGVPGAYLPGRLGERVTYRQALLDPGASRPYRDDRATAR